MGKKGNIDLTEIAFLQMNNTLNTMLSTISLNKDLGNADDECNNWQT